MPGPTPFISSCSRRQLARRRALRPFLGRVGYRRWLSPGVGQLAYLTLLVALAVLSFSLGRGGL